MLFRSQRSREHKIHQQRIFGAWKPVWRRTGAISFSRPPVPPFPPRRYSSVLQPFSARVLPLPYPLRLVPPFPGPSPTPHMFFISFLCPPVPAPSSSTTMLLHSFSLFNVHSKFRPLRSLGRTLSVPYYPYSTLPWPISSFCYSSLLFL